MKEINEINDLLNICQKSSIGLENHGLSSKARLQLHQMYVDNVWSSIAFRYGLASFNKLKSIYEIMDENYEKTAWKESYYQLKKLNKHFIGWSNLRNFLQDDMQKNGDPWTRLRMPDISCLIAEARPFEIIYALENWIVEKNILVDSSRDAFLNRLGVLLRIETLPYKKLMIEKVGELDTENADVLEFLIQATRDSIDKFGNKVVYSKIGELFSIIDYEPVEKWAEIMLGMNSGNLWKNNSLEKAFYKSFQDSMLEYMKKPESNAMQRFITALDIENVRESAVICNDENQTVVIDFEAFRFLSDAISLLGDSVKLPNNSPLYRLTNVNLIENVKLYHAEENLQEIIFPILEKMAPNWSKALSIGLYGHEAKLLKFEISKDVENSSELYGCIKKIIKEAFYHHCLDDNIDSLCSTFITEAVMNLDREKLAHKESLGKTNFKKF